MTTHGDLTGQAQQYQDALKAERRVKRANLGLAVFQGTALGLGADPSTRGLSGGYIPTSFDQGPTQAVRHSQRIDIEERLFAIADALAVVGDARASAQAREAAANSAASTNALSLLNTILLGGTKNGEAWSRNQGPIIQKRLGIAGDKMVVGEAFWSLEGPEPAEGGMNKLVAGQYRPTPDQWDIINNLEDWMGAKEGSSVPATDLITGMSNLTHGQIQALMEKYPRFSELYREMENASATNRPPNLDEFSVGGMDGNQAQNFFSVMNGKEELQAKLDADRGRASTEYERVLKEPVGGASMWDGISDELKPIAGELLRTVTSQGRYVPSLERMAQIEGQMSGASEEDIQVVITGMRDRVESQREAQGEQKKILGRQEALEDSNTRLLGMLEELNQPNPPRNVAEMKQRILIGEGFTAYKKSEGLQDDEMAFQHLMSTSIQKLRAAKEADEVVLTQKAIEGQDPATPTSPVEDQPGSALTAGATPESGPTAEKLAGLTKKWGVTQKPRLKMDWQPGETDWQKRSLFSGT